MTEKSVKRSAFILALVLFLLIYGCRSKGDTQNKIENVRVGTEGIVMNFLANNPPAKIHVEEAIDNIFKVVLEVRNKGAYPQPEQSVNFGPEGRVYLSGYDPNIIILQSQNRNSGDLSQMALEGKSSINPNGGFDVLTFTGTIDATALNVERYEPSLLATACYKYETVAGPSVCIDPDPYSTISERKVCNIQGIQLSSQGAPVAITQINEEAFAQKTAFKIAIKNVGNGEIIKEESVEKCNPYGLQKIERDDLDKIFLEEVRVSQTPLICGPFTDTGAAKSESGYVRLINGEGYVICELSKDAYSESNTAYTTPLIIKLRYGYRTTTERKLLIIKETS